MNEITGALPSPIELQHIEKLTKQVSVSLYPNLPPNMPAAITETLITLLSCGMLVTQTTGTWPTIAQLDSGSRVRTLTAEPSSDLRDIVGLIKKTIETADRVVGITTLMRIDDKQQSEPDYGCIYAFVTSGNSAWRITAPTPFRPQRIDFSAAEYHLITPGRGINIAERTRFTTCT